MRIFSSCQEAINSCIETRTFAVAHLYSGEKTMDIHIHDCYELYFSISGGKQFLIDNRLYTVSPGDVFCINQFESHHLTQIDKETHERIVVSIYPSYLKSLSTERTDLDAVFRMRKPGHSHRTHLTQEERNRFLFFVDNLAETDGYGADVMERSFFAAFMTTVAGWVAEHTKAERAKTSQYATLGKESAKRWENSLKPGIHSKVDEVLSYINRHVGDPLALEDIARECCLSPSYLCKIFKVTTGTTVNKYVTAKRITAAKQLIAGGHDVSTACERIGFNDYSTFYRAFKTATGISPQKYYQYTNGQAPLKSTTPPWGDEVLNPPCE